MERLWEVDSIRGVAIAMMVVSNLFFDLDYFTALSLPQEGPLLYLARVTAGLFILVAGISLTLSRSRSRGGFGKYLSRGSRLFGVGLLITAASWTFAGEGLVLFGILHMIGLGVVLSYPLLERKHASLALGAALLAAGLLLQGMRFSFPWLLWLGLAPQGYYSVDYVPLLPWYGVMLLGVFAGNALFPAGKRRFRLPDLSGSIPVRALAGLGRNSLKIYLLHQPVLVWAILLLGYL